jgi:hypothetical protein
MKLLFDQNLSFNLCRSLTDLFAGTSQVRLVGLADASDRTLWNYAKDNGFTLVSLDSDFAEMAALLCTQQDITRARDARSHPAAPARPSFFRSLDGLAPTRASRSPPPRALRPW